MTGISIIKPMEVTPAMLVSSNVPETDHAEWAVGTTYGKGDRVILAAQHKVYQSAIDGNVGKDPAVDKTAWLEVGFTNRWKPFDKSITSQVVQASSIQYRIKPGVPVTSVSLLNITSAVSLHIQVIDPVYGIVRDKTVNLSRLPLRSGWWAWFFGERRAPTQVILSDLPTYPNADILIEITGGAGLAVGVILLGQVRTFGLGPRVGMRLGIQDYSRKDRNEFGDVILVERAFAKRISFSTALRSHQLDELFKFLSEIRATPCLWVVSYKYETAVAYAFYRSFDIVLPYSDYFDCEIELEGLT